MKQIPLPTCCPLCSSELIKNYYIKTIDSTDSNSTEIYSEYCPDCKYGNRLRFVMYYVDNSVSSITIIPSDIELSISLLQETIYLKKVETNIDLTQRCMFRYTEFNLFDIPSIEKKIRLLLAFS